MTPDLTGSGTLSGAVVAPSIVGMGMDKSGTHSVSSSQTNQPVVTWTTRSGYPSTVITSNTLVASGAGNVTAQCRVTLSASWFSGTSLQFDVTKNGVSIGTMLIPFGSAVGTFTPIPASLTNGDTIGLIYTAPFGGSGTINGGSTSTYLYYDPT